MTWEGSRHFDLREIGEGVYAAIATPEGLAVGNAGLVDLGDRLVLFDTFCNHLAARDLEAAAQALTGKPVAFVVNSHAHRDHVKGNQVFADAAIVATRRAAERMTATWTARTERVRKEGLEPLRSDIRKEFAAWKAHPATDDADRVLWASYERAILEDLDHYELRLPTASFETSLRFHGPRRTADALTFGGGHSASDAILHVPDARVAFLGDLLFVGVQPFLADGDPEEYLRILDKIEGLDAQTLVPGHGPLGTPKDLETMRDYVHALETTASEAIASGRDPKEATRAIPKPFDTLAWKGFWSENVEFLLRRGASAPPR